MLAINKRFLAIIMVIVVAVIAWLVYASWRFHITGTDPSLNNLPAFTKQLSVNFNRPLASTGLRVSSPDNIVKSVKVSGKSIIIGLAGNLALAHNYEIDINNVQSTSGSRLTSQALKFKTTNDFSSLPADQQQQILNQQKPAPSKDTIDYQGLDNLTNKGLSAVQLDEFKQGVFNFSQSQHKTYSLVRIPAGSVTTPPYNPDTSNGVFSISFTAAIDGVSYSGRVEYSGLQTLRLIIMSPSGGTLYDSGTLTNPAASAARE